MSSPGAVVITANTTGTKIANVRKKRSLQEYRYTIMGYGTYGGGTLSWFVSPDQGTTLIAMTDLTDAALTMTSNKAFDGSLCTGSLNSNALQIWASLSGASSPSVTAAVYDNQS